MRPIDVEELSPQDRLHELARLLAIGLLRWRDHSVLAQETKPASECLPGEFSKEGLEVPTKTVLSVHSS